RPSRTTLFPYTTLFRSLGPGQGEAGGQIIFQGPFKALLKHPASLTGKYLSGREQIPVPTRRPIKSSSPKLNVRGAARYNLKNLRSEEHTSELQSRGHLV